MVEWLAVAAEPEPLLALIRDQAQRHRFLPDGWRVLRSLSEQTASVGARMELQARFGPAINPHVIQLIEMGDDFITEGPPGGENFLTTWIVQARGEDTIVQVEVLFSYGGIMGEYFVRRGLRRDMRQMLRRLKLLSEARS